MSIREVLLYCPTSGSYISRTGRRPHLLLPNIIENYIKDDDPTRFMNAFVNQLDLLKLEFEFS
ncbi:MAG: hypothetical protein M0T81_09145 [Thermoplasmatales archaeon]|nr:hypothetical protein [Thermoplasmatales archaeon]